MGFKSSRRCKARCLYEDRISSGADPYKHFEKEAVQTQLSQLPFHSIRFQFKRPSNSISFNSFELNSTSIQLKSFHVNSISFQNNPNQINSVELQFQFRFQSIQLQIQVKSIEFKFDSFSIHFHSIQLNPIQCTSNEVSSIKILNFNSPSKESNSIKESISIQFNFNRFEFNAIHYQFNSTEFNFNVSINPNQTEAISIQLHISNQFDCLQLNFDFESNHFKSTSIQFDFNLNQGNEFSIQLTSPEWKSEKEREMKRIATTARRSLSNA